MGVADVNNGRDRGVDGRGLGRLRQRRLRGPLPLQVGAAGAVPQRRWQGVHARHGHAPACRRGSTPTRPIWLDYDRDGRLDLFLGGYYRRSGQPLAPVGHTDDAGKLRIRQERRPQVPASETSDGKRFEDVTEASRASTAAAGRWPPPRRTCAERAIRTCSSPTTTASRSSSPTTAGKTFREIGEKTGDRLAPQKRDERRLWGHLQPGPFGDLRHEHLRGQGVLIQGNNLWVPEDGTSARQPRVRQHGRASGSGARRLELRRPVRRPEQRRLSICTSPTATSPLEPEASYWYDFSKMAGGNSAIISDAAELAADRGQKPVRLSAEARLAERRRRGISRSGAAGRRDGHLRRPRRGPRGFWNRGVLDVIVANQNGAAARLPNTVAPGERLDRVRAGGRGQQPERDRRRRCVCSGTASSSFRRSPAAADSARRTTADSTSASARTRASSASRSGGPRARTRRSRTRARIGDCLHSASLLHRGAESIVVTPSRVAGGDRAESRSGLRAARQPLHAAAPSSRSSCSAGSSRSASWRASSGRCWRSRRRSCSRSCSGSCSSGRSRISASAYISGISVGILVRSPLLGRTPCAARSRSRRSTCFA